jgi:uncharacterized protein (TIGR03545 family)
MRKKFVFFALVPFLVFLLVVYLFLDRWVESGLEYAGERIAEAKVEIDGLHVGLMPLGIEFRRLQVANKRDPWKNVFETGRVKFLMDFSQLLRGKFIIETMEINDLILGTKRTSDGSLPPAPPPSHEPPGAISGLTQSVEQTVGSRLKEAPVFDLGRLRAQLNIDSLLNVKNLKTVQYADSVKRLAESVKAHWGEGLGEIQQAKVKLAEVETKLRAIKPNELKTIESITSAVTTVNDATAAITSINQTFSARRTALATDIEALSSAVGSMNGVIDQDYEMLRSLARIPSVSLSGMASLLIGRQMYDEVLEYLSWVAFVRDKIPVVRSTPDIETPPRMRGQDIRFPVAQSYPKFWIKNAVLSGGTDSAQNTNYYYVKGTISNISNNQMITRKPLSAQLTATRAGSVSIRLGATIDRTTDVPRDDYQASAQGLVVKGIELGRADFLPSSISRALAGVDVAVRVPARDVDATAQIGFRNIALSFERDPRTVVERLVHDVLTSIHAFSTTLHVWSREGRLDVALTTDLDDQLVAETKKVVGAEITRLQNELRAKLNERVAQKKAEAEHLVSERLGEARGEVRALEATMSQNLALAQTKKKELEDRIEQEKNRQTDAAKKKLEDAVKGLFKKP